MSQSGGLTVTTPGVLTVGTPVSGDSGNVANAAATATLPAAVGKTTYLDGLCIAALGATAGAIVLVTITGPANTINYAFAVPTGATVAQAPFEVELLAPIPAAAPNTAIVATLPALGAGNTAARITTHGRQL